MLYLYTYEQTMSLSQENSSITLLVGMLGEIQLFLSNLL